MSDRIKRAGWLLVTAAIATLDLWSKALWTYPADVPHGRGVLQKEVFDGWLNFTTIWNPGGVWSAKIPGGVLLWGTALAIPAILVWILAPARARRWETFAKALILGGAIGNFYDRWHWNAVRDWIDVYFGDPQGWHWPIFNVADMALVGGIGVLLILSFLPEHAKDSEAAAAGKVVA